MTVIHYTVLMPFFLLISYNNIPVFVPCGSRMSFIKARDGWDENNEKLCHLNSRVCTRKILNPKVLQIYLITRAFLSGSYQRRVLSVVTLWKLKASTILGRNWRRLEFSTPLSTPINLLSNSDFPFYVLSSFILFTYLMWLTNDFYLLSLETRRRHSSLGWKWGWINNFRDFFYSTSCTFSSWTMCVRLLLVFKIFFTKLLTDLMSCW